MARWKNENDLSSDYRDDSHFRGPRQLSNEVDLTPTHRYLTLGEEVARRARQGSAARLTASVKSAEEETKPKWLRLEHCLLDRRHIRKAGD